MVKLVYDKRNCVGCPPEMGCLGRDCPQCYETVMRCDVCGKETRDLYRWDGDVDLCENCFDEKIEKIHITYDNCEDFINGSADR